MVPAEVLQRTFQISYRGRNGSAFALDVDGKQYMVTAKHLVEEVTGDDEIELKVEAGWRRLPAKLVGHAADEVDLSVLALSESLCPATLQPRLGCAGIYFSQDAYFLGFPLGLFGGAYLEPLGHPLPLVKKALVSGIWNGATQLLLDGHNNPGFSGGPVVFAKDGQGPANTVAAIVAGFHESDEPIMADDKETSFTYRANTGIIYAFSIDIALKLIGQNPIGFIQAS